MELTSPMNMKIPLNVEKVSLKTGGDWQKDFCTTKAIIKHTDSGKNRGVAIMLGPVPLVGGTEDEKETLQSREPPGGVSSSSHILGTTSLEFDIRKTGPLNRLENQWD